MDDNDKIEKICEGIRIQAEQQKEKILKSAEENAQKIIDEADNKAKIFEEQEKQKNEEDIQRLKERIYSTETIEKKRIILIQQGVFVKKVFDKIIEIANNFRSSPQYKDFLKKSIKEGIDVIAMDKIEVAYSMMDEKFFDTAFTEDVKKFCNPDNNKKLTIDFQKENFNDIGVIIRSFDKRIIYDNRFSIKFNRLKVDLQINIIKEIFKNV